MPKFDKGWLLFEEGKAVQLERVARVLRLPLPPEPAPQIPKTALLLTMGGWLEVDDEYDEVMKAIISNTP